MHVLVWRIYSVSVISDLPVSRVGTCVPRVLFAGFSR